MHSRCCQIQSSRNLNLWHGQIESVCDSAMALPSRDFGASSHGVMGLSQAMLLVWGRFSIRLRLELGQFAEADSPVAWQNPKTFGEAERGSQSASWRAPHSHLRSVSEDLHFLTHLIMQFAHSIVGNPTRLESFSSIASHCMQVGCHLRLVCAFSNCLKARLRSANAGFYGHLWRTCTFNVASTLI